MRNKFHKLVGILVAVLMFSATPVFANIEMLDELTYGAKIQSQDLILKSDHIDIGAEIGTFDFTNSKTIKDNFYAMGVITIKGWSIFNLSK